MARTPSVRAKPPHLPSRIRRTVRNVILVDDDTLERAALSRLLRAGGYVVTAFERPNDVLLSLLPVSNVCLLLDVYMPVMSGVSLWRELRSRGYQAPTILITGRRDLQTNIYCSQVEAVATLYKPIEEEELFEAIEKALSTAS